MKYSIFFLLLFIAKCSIAQKIVPIEKSVDLLKKYTYFVITLRGGEHNGLSGSGFFLKRNGKSYFITNYHVATTYNAREKIYGVATDEIGIRIYVDSKWAFMPLDIKRDTIFEDEIYLLKKPDLKIFEITPPENSEINYVPDSIPKKYFRHSPSKIFVYGFPAMDVSPELIPTGKMVIAPFILFDSISRYSKPDGIDDSTFLKRYLDMYVVVKIGALPGMSGSPIFGEVTDGTTTDIVFLGIMCAADDSHKIAETIPRQQIFRFIDGAN